MMLSSNTGKDRAAAGHLRGLDDTFTGCGDPAAVEEILAERLGGLGVPMIAWADAGHGGFFQTFPIGVAAELDADTATLRLLEPPLLPAGEGPGRPVSR